MACYGALFLRAANGCEIACIQLSIDEPLSVAQSIIASENPNPVRGHLKIDDPIGACCISFAEDKGVRTRTTCQRVFACSADKNVIASVSTDVVGAAPTTQDIVRLISLDNVCQLVASGIDGCGTGECQLFEEITKGVRDGTLDGINSTVVNAGTGTLLADDIANVINSVQIIATATIHRVSAGTAVDDVISGTAIEQIIPAYAVQLVLSFKAKDSISPRLAGDAVIGARSKDVAVQNTAHVTSANSKMTGRRSGPQSRSRC